MGEGRIGRSACACAVKRRRISEKRGAGKRFVTKKRISARAPGPYAPPAYAMAKVVSAGQNIAFAPARAVCSRMRRIQMRRFRMQRRLHLCSGFCLYLLLIKMRGKIRRGRKHCAFIRKWHRHSPLGGLSASLRDGNRLRVRQSCLQTCLRDPNDNFIISRFSLFFNPVFQTAPAVFAGADDRRGKEKQGKASYVRGNADGILKNAGEPLHPASSSRTTRSPSGLPAA